MPGRERIGGSDERGLALLEVALAIALIAIASVGFNQVLKDRQEGRAERALAAQVSNVLDSIQVHAAVSRAVAEMEEDAVLVRTPADLRAEGLVSQAYPDQLGPEGMRYGWRAMIRRGAGDDFRVVLHLTGGTPPRTVREGERFMRLTGRSGIWRGVDENDLSFTNLAANRQAAMEMAVVVASDGDASDQNILTPEMLNDVVYAFAASSTPQTALLGPEPEPEPEIKYRLLDATASGDWGGGAVPGRIDGVYFTWQIPNRGRTFLNPLGHMPLTRDVALKLAMKDEFGQPLWELEWVKNPAEADVLSKTDITAALSELECAYGEKKVIIAAPKSLIDGEVVKEGGTYLAENVPTETTKILTEGADPEIAERSLLYTTFRQRFATARGSGYADWTPYFYEPEEKPVASFAMRRAWPEEIVDTDDQGRKSLRVKRDGETVLIPEEAFVPLPFHTGGRNVEGSGVLNFPGGDTLSYKGYDGRHWAWRGRIGGTYLPGKQAGAPPISSNYKLAIHHDLAEHKIGEKTTVLTRLGKADGWRPIFSSVESLTRSIRDLRNKDNIRLNKGNNPLAFGVLPGFQADAKRILDEELLEAGYTRQGGGIYQWGAPDDAPSTEELYGKVMTRLGGSLPGA